MTHAVPRSLAAQRRLDWRGKGQNQAVVLQEGGTDSLDNVLAAEQLPLLSDLTCSSLSPTPCHHVCLECCRPSGICLLMCKGPFVLPSAHLVLRCFTHPPQVSLHTFYLCPFCGLLCVQTVPLVFKLCLQLSLACLSRLLFLYSQTPIFPIML